MSKKYSKNVKTTDFFQKCGENDSSTHIYNNPPFTNTIRRTKPTTRIIVLWEIKSAIYYCNDSALMKGAHPYWHGYKLPVSRYYSFTNG